MCTTSVECKTIITAVHTVMSGMDVTPTFYKNKYFSANRGAYKNAYQIIVHMKNFQKINLV
jgi:hypothetical protein